MPKGLDWHEDKYDAPGEPDTEFVLQGQLRQSAERAEWDGTSKHMRHVAARRKHDSKTHDWRSVSAAADTGIFRRHEVRASYRATDWEQAARSTIPSDTPCAHRP